MEAKLIVVGGKANKAEVQLTLPAVIGRGRDADLTVAHATVSRRHCLLYEHDGALVVRDNGSLNGTVIEGERIQEAVLRPGATLTVGPLTFRAEYEHQGDFPNLGAQPKFTKAAAAAQPANGTLYEESPAEPASDSEIALGLPEPAHAVQDESPSFGFLSDTAESPAAPPVDDEPPLSASAKAGQASADSGEIAGIGLAAGDEPAAAQPDSADFGFLGGLGESDASSGADSQLPEITLHDPEESPAANADSGEYALLSDTPVSPLDFPAEEKPVARGDQTYSLSAPSSESSADADEHRPAKPSPTKQAGKKNIEEAPVQASAADSRASDSDIDAAALAFLSDAPAAASAEKSPKRVAKPAERSPDIKVGAEPPKATTAEDEELNSFFNSLGLD